MKKILLVCAAGMSTSLLVNKMKESAIRTGDRNRYRSITNIRMLNSDR